MVPPRIDRNSSGQSVRGSIYKAWITTNGLNCGVAALIGSARRELGREFGDTVPIIGFPRWDEIRDNELLVKDGPSQVNFSSKSGVQYYTKDLGWFEFTTWTDYLLLLLIFEPMYRKFPSSN